MSDVKSIIWGLFFVLIMVAWIGHGCKGRVEQFRERRDERRDERKEERKQRREEHQSIFDRWRARRESNNDSGTS